MEVEKWDNTNLLGKSSDGGGKMGLSTNGKSWEIHLKIVWNTRKISWGILQRG
jgi:hypothetical protein